MVGGDERPYQCAACGIWDMTEFDHGHTYCIECNAIDGKRDTPEEEAHLEALYVRISSAMPDAPPKWTTETPGEVP